MINRFKLIADQIFEGYDKIYDEIGETCWLTNVIYQGREYVRGMIIVDRNFTRVSVYEPNNPLPMGKGRYRTCSLLGANIDRFFWTR